MVVPDVEAARAELVERGADVSEIQDFPWRTFVFFSDPRRQRVGGASRLAKALVTN
jgi:hypothetical protein